MPADRCEVCGWPLVEDWREGCVPGNCSQRPRPKVSPKVAQIADLERRLAEAEAQLHTAEDVWCRERDAMSAKIIGMEAQLAAVDNMVGGLLRERELTFEGERAVSILALVNWLEGQTKHKVSIVEELLAEEREKRQWAVEALRKFGQHTHDCSNNGLYLEYQGQRPDCICGLSEAAQEGKP